MAAMVKIYQKNNILFSGMPITFINLLRRICITQIPIYAIDTVEVYENQSLLIDEMLVHRLAMIPLSVPACQKNTKYNIEFKIKAQQDSYITVRDMFIQNNDVKINLPKEDDIIVAPLQKDCMIWIKAELKLGTMQEHAKWASCWAYLNHFNHLFEIHDYQPDQTDETITDLTQKAYTHYKELVDKLDSFPKLKHKTSTIYPHTILFIETQSDYTSMEIYKLTLLKLLEMTELPN